MTSELLITVGIGEVWAAFCEDGCPVELRFEKDRSGATPEEIYRARVAKILPETDTAILDLGNQNFAALPARHARAPERPRKGIAELMREGEQVFAEIIREARNDGRESKHAVARVYRGNTENFEQGDKLRLVRPAPDRIERLLRDTPQGAVIQVDDAATQANLRARLGPEQAARVKLVSDGGFWEESGAADCIEEIAAGVIPLSGGGSLLIEIAAGITVVDVNTGTASGRDARHEVNLAAAQEVARQLRLQNLSGPIVVDLIGNGDTINGKAVLAAFDDVVRGDPLTVQRSRVSRFGLLEITREGRGRPLREMLCQPAIRRPSASYSRQTLLRRALAEARTGGPGTLILEVTEEMKQAFEANPELLVELSTRTGRRVELREADSPATYVSGASNG